MSDPNHLLRDRYLQLWISLIQQEPIATFHLHSNCTVEGKLCGTDSENNRFRVNQLKSPLGIYEKAVIRGTDVNRIEL